MREAAWSSDLKVVQYLVTMARELSPEVEYDDLFCRLSFETEIMVASHWSAIERVALGLLKWGDLDGRGVDEAIGPGRPVA
jgi:hypothetical protein